MAGRHPECPGHDAKCASVGREEAAAGPVVIATGGAVAGLTGRAGVVPPSHLLCHHLLGGQQLGLQLRNLRTTPPA